MLTRIGNEKKMLGPRPLDECGYEWFRDKTHFPSLCSCSFNVLSSALKDHDGKSHFLVSPQNPAPASLVSATPSIRRQQSGRPHSASAPGM